MKALSYLLLTQIKNKILSLRKKPGLLTLYCIVLLMIIISTIFLILAGNNLENEVLADERIIYMVISGFGLLYLMTFALSGLSTGSTLFTMADVGLLFVAPISTKKILLYGLISTMGKALLAAVFIFYQAFNLKSNFGYGLQEILALFFIYAILVLFNQLLSIAIYIFSNGNQSRKNLVRTILYAFIGLLILAVYLIMKEEQIGILEAAFRLVDRKWFGYIPIAGWATMFFQGVVTGSLYEVLISLAFFVFIGILVISLLTMGNADYYEDVLTSTEITFQRLRDSKEGRNISSKPNKKIKIKEEEHGLNKGMGAMAIAYKHMLEIKRSSRFVYIDTYTLIATVIVGIIGYKSKDEFAAYLILGGLIYIQFFFTLFGRLKLELMKPYIYLIPESSFKKILAASLSSLLKPCVDAIIVFGVLAAVGGASIMQCIFMALAYSASGAVFVGLTIVYQRVLGGQPNRLVQMLIGIFLLFIVMAPGITASVITAFFLPSQIRFLCTLPYVFFCLFCAFIMFFACKDLIDKSEYTGKI